MTTSSTSAATTVELGSARALICRECGNETSLAAEFACTECFGPLEVGYDFPTLRRADIEAGPQSIWRYRSLLPVPADVAAHPNTEPGMT
ncbi:MAG: threonine synthase, partial [Sciscionella sp.]